MHARSAYLSACLIRKVDPPRIKQTIADYFRLYRSRKPVQGGLTDKARQYITRQRAKGVPAAKIAADLGISARYVRILWVRFQRTRTTKAPIGRPRSFPAETQIRLVQDVHQEQPVGVVKTTVTIRQDHDTHATTPYTMC